MIPIKTKSIIIPDLCRNSNLLLIIAFTELIIIIAWLLTSATPEVEVLGKWSLYTQWLVLINCASLCILRSHISKLGLVAGVFAVIANSIGSLILMEMIAAAWSSGFTGASFFSDRLLYFVLADILLVVMLLRYFRFLAEMEFRNVAESESRVAALQSRIQPHFLFNSLNTIAELTASQPEQAEQAINSLSMLFRASLENNRKTHTLASELKLCERYIELERWRVADRLSIEWEVHVDGAEQWSIPKLILQPLVENAIVHGVRGDGSIEILVDVRETKRHISIKVENAIDNALGEDGREQQGHGIALDNIRERLIVMYDDQQSFRVKRDSERYSVIMQFPKTPYSINENRK